MGSFTYLTGEFVERRIGALVSIPETWGVDGGGVYNELDLKMCQIKTLLFDFEWGKEKYASYICPVVGLAIQFDSSISTQMHDIRSCMDRLQFQESKPDALMRTHTHQMYAHTYTHAHAFTDIRSQGHTGKHTLIPTLICIYHHHV